MFRRLRKRFDPLCRHMLDGDGPSALTHRPDKVREISIGRHLLEHRAQRRLGRVCARDLQSTEAPILVHHIDGTPVGEMLNDELSHGRQRLLVVERRRQQDAGLSQKLLFLFHVAFAR